MKSLLIAVAVAAVGLVGCDSLPRDPDHTLERIRSERLFRVGIIADGDGAIPGQGAAFIAWVSQATGAKAAVRQGASEPLLLDLQAGKLDLVLGTIAPESPWAPEVAILPPLSESTAPQHLIVSPIVRNGENRWIMLLEAADDGVASHAT
jgi:hypothetical protein